MTWCGKDIQDMSREELIDVLTRCAMELKNHQSPEASYARALGMVEIIKRGATHDPNR